MQRILDGYKFFIYGDAKGREAEFKTAKEIKRITSLPVDYVTDDTLLLYRCYEYVLDSFKCGSIIPSYKYFEKFREDLDNSKIERAPGDALLQATNEKEPLIDSKGCGAMCRVPAYCILLHLGFPFNTVFKLVKEDIVLSHTDSETVAYSLCYLILYYILAFEEDSNESLSKKVISFILFLGDELDFTFSEEDFIFSGSTDVWQTKDIFVYLLHICANELKPFNLMRAALKIDGDSDSVAALAGFLIPWLYDDFTVNNYKSLIWQEVNASSEVALYNDFFCKKMFEIEKPE